MAKWYLNPFLTTWRNAINKRHPKRGKTSDGSIGDLAHSKTPSEHNPDPDGSVDAFDCDVNLNGSKTETGTPDERAAMYVLLHEFQQQDQAQLWIFRRQIANRDIGNWKKRPYGGMNAHDKHAHFQSRAARENQPFKGELDAVVEAPQVKPGDSYEFGVRTLKKGMTGPDVAHLQRWLGLKDDGIFGSVTEAAVKRYQRLRSIVPDGICGPATYREMRVTR